LTKFEFENAFEENDIHRYDRTNPMRFPGFDLVERVSELSEDNAGINTAVALKTSESSSGNKPLLKYIHFIHTTYNINRRIPCDNAIE
jgi:hypothetical protein